jgi:hypothetical protein
MAANVVDRDVTPIRSRYRKQSRFHADHCQRLAKSRDRVGWSAMGWVEPGYDMYGMQDTFFCRFLRRVLPRPLSAAGSGKMAAICSA